MYTTYIYDGTFHGLITAVYEAFYAKLPVAEVRILDQAQAEEAPNLFDIELRVLTSEEKAEKVLSALIQRTSYDTYHNIYIVYLSFYPNKGDLIFQYIKLCFTLGKKVFQHISHPLIADILRITKRVGGETQKLRGFVRFQELESGALFSRITPVNNQLELLAPHFADRLATENWILYDANRELACVHRAGKGFLITDDIPQEILEDHMEQMNSKAELKYQSLWKAFFETIGIESRRNYRCQRTMMPKRYWENMLEVRDKQQITK